MARFKAALATLLVFAFAYFAYASVKPTEEQKWNWQMEELRETLSR